MSKQVTFKTAQSILAAHRAATSKDIEACLKETNIKFGFSETTFKTLRGLNVDFSVLFALPQKQIKRALQFANAVAAKTYKNVDATTACGLYAMHIATDNALSYDSLHVLICGQARTDGATGDTKGVSRMKLHRMFSRVGVNTVSTQKSRSFGDNGFCDALGMTAAKHRTQDRIVTLNKENPLVSAFVAMIDNATDSQLDELATGGKSE